jgi:hypothetical protein
VRAMWMWGVGVDFSLSVPSLASMPASLGYLYINGV